MATSYQVKFLDRSTPAHIFTLICLTGVSALSMNLFLPSLPGMAEFFDAPYAQIQLTVSLYLFASALLQLILGPLSDKFGRRPVVLWGFALFMLATVGCIFSPNIQTFLAFRMAQATVVVGMAVGRASVRDVVPPAQAASLIGYITMGMAIAPMIAPAIGGALDEAFGWQASFSMLLGLGVVAFLLGWKDMGETAPKRDISIFQQFREYPVLLTSRRFWAYALTNAFTSGSFFAYLGGAPFVGSAIYGLPPTYLGTAFAAPALGYATGNYLSGRFSVQVGILPMILTGATISTIGIAGAAIVTYAGLGSVYVFFGAMIFVGVGNGLAIPNTTSATLSVRPELAGTASGLGGALMIGGGAALSAYAGTLLSIESGPLPLLILMLASAVASVITALYARQRDQFLAKN